MSDLLIIVGIVLLLIALAVTLFALFSYSGLLHVPEVWSGPPPLGSCQIAYKFLRGAYGGVMVGMTFTELTSILPKSRIIGIFYDDPDEVAEDDQRSVVGCVLTGEESQEVMDSLASNEFKLFQLPEVGHAVLSSFPYTTPFSIKIAAGKVYPLLSNYIAEKGLCAYPMVEVFTASEILYMAPLSKQEAFFVPESIQLPEDKGDKEESDGDEGDSDDGSNSEEEYPEDADSEDENMPPEDEEIKKHHVKKSSVELMARRKQATDSEGEKKGTVKVTENSSNNDTESEDGQSKPEHQNPTELRNRHKNRRSSRIRPDDSSSFEEIDNPPAEMDEIEQKKA